MAPDPINVDALIAAGAVLGQRGLLWGTGGNLSRRLDRGRFLITGTGTRLEQLTGQDLIACRVADGPRETDPRASSEVPLHRRIYQRRSDVGAVLHLSPPWATLVCCTEVELPLDLIPESVLYLERIARIPYLEPGSDALGLAAAEALADGAAVLMGNHGPVTVGATLDEAVRRMETLEFLARLVVTARGANLPLTGIGPSAAAALRASAYSRSS